MARICIHCDSGKGMTRFENETFTISHGGATAKLAGLSGWRCSACHEVEFDARSAKRYAAAGDRLVMNARRALGMELRRIRRRLNLTQAEAARLTGGGHNAFSRYERGEVVPMPSVVNLFLLLNKYPELLRDLKKPAARATRRRPIARTRPKLKIS
jgi:HTH-type transcriptional regulator/antitoxin MqsA